MSGRPRRSPTVLCPASPPSARVSTRRARGECARPWPFNRLHASGDRSGPLTAAPSRYHTVSGRTGESRDRTTTTSPDGAWRSPRSCDRPDPDDPIRARAPRARWRDPPGDSQSTHKCVAGHEPATRIAQSDEPTPRLQVDLPERDRIHQSGVPTPASSQTSLSACCTKATFAQASSHSSMVAALGSPAKHHERWRETPPVPGHTCSHTANSCQHSIAYGEGP